MTAAIEATGLSRSFGGVTAVRDASLTVQPGEITALVGPNGSGKTTLMLMLATLLRPDSGTVSIGGNDVTNNVLGARAALGWMPDTLGAWSTLTVRETLLAVCGMYGMRGSAAAVRTEELLERTGLQQLAQQRTNTLSRGQKQRLSLARALAHHPSVLLLDEPASGLDPEARLTQRRMLAELAAEGVAILVTSHVLDELEQLASSVVFLQDGRTEVPSTVEAALRRGSTWRVRSLDPAKLELTLAAAGLAWQTQHTLTGLAHVVTVADETEAASLIASLTASGVPIVEFGPASSALEQAFVELSSTPPAATVEEEE